MLRNEFFPVLHHVLRRPQADLLAQAIGVSDVVLEPRDDAEHPDGDLRGVQEIRVVLVDVEQLTPGGHEPHPAHDARQARVPRPRAVSRGGHGPRDVLGVDVALVAQREAGFPQRLIEVVDPRTGERGCALPLGVRVQDAAPRREVEQHSIGLDDRRERVPGTRNPHPQSPLRGLSDDSGHLLLVARCSGEGWSEGLAAHPIRPRGCRQAGQHGRDQGSSNSW